eukprot:9491292-Pyramimonas_sp.AAC.1
MSYGDRLRLVLALGPEGRAEAHQSGDDRGGGGGERPRGLPGVGAHGAAHHHRHRHGGGQAQGGGAEAQQGAGGRRCGHAHTARGGELSAACSESQKVVRVRQTSSIGPPIKRE